MSLSFFNTYAQRISLASDAPQDAFYSTDEYSRLDTLGPSFPRLPYALPRATPASVEHDSVDIVLKSIKPPFKFTTTLQAVPESTSVYRIKTQLVASVAVLADAGAQPADLKFMVKSKVLSDATQLAAVPRDGPLAITVMVTPPVAPAKRAVLPEAPLVAPATWEKIYTLLAGDLGAEAAKDALAKFKAVHKAVH